MGMSRVSRYFSLKPHIAKWVEDKKNKRKVIIAYAATPVFTGLLRLVKKLDSAVTTILIVPDLPQYMNISRGKSFAYRNLKKLETRKILKDIEFVDGFVLLTEHMKSAFGIKAPYVVMEGIAADPFDGTVIEGDKDRDGTRTVLYSGALSEEYGVNDLVNAFARLPNPEFRLVICGEGVSEDFIRREARKDPRINYMGLVARNEVLKLQKAATILINPRSNEHEYAKYSFPSKILEYMSSGTPVAAYRLDGVPPEYYRHMYIIEGCEHAIYKALVEALSKTDEELSAKGRNARAFVMTEKNAAVQTMKIVGLIGRITFGAI
jgi:glycosyltransferase involved in cell wall biosynthesis